MIYNPIEANEKKRLEDMQKKEASMNPAGAGEKPIGKTSIGIGMKHGGAIKGTPPKNNLSFKNRGGIISNGGKDYRKSGMFYG
tara:strand:+ start:412 stop:660 length:249 start_codon:yes stop_codon:yes gene_type:complete